MCLCFSRRNGIGIRLGTNGAFCYSRPAISCGLSAYCLTNPLRYGGYAPSWTYYAISIYFCILCTFSLNENCSRILRPGGLDCRPWSLVFGFFRPSKGFLYMRISRYFCNGIFLVSIVLFCTVTFGPFCNWNGDVFCPSVVFPCRPRFRVLNGGGNHIRLRFYIRSRVLLGFPYPFFFIIGYVLRGSDGFCGTGTFRRF